MCLFTWADGESFDVWSRATAKDAVAMVMVVWAVSVGASAGATGAAGAAGSAAGAAGVAGAAGAAGSGVLLHAASANIATNSNSVRIANFFILKTS